MQGNPKNRNVITQEHLAPQGYRLFLAVVKHSSGPNNPSETDIRLVYAKDELGARDKVLLHYHRYLIDDVDITEPIY